MKQAQVITPNGKLASRKTLSDIFSQEVIPLLLFLSKEAFFI